MNIAGKTIVITGSGRGLGAAMAKRLACAGARLALVDLEAQALKDTREACTSAGSPDVQTYVTNIAEE